MYIYINSKISSSYVYIYMGKVNYIEIIVCIYYTFILSYAKVCVMRILLQKRRHPSFDIA